MDASPDETTDAQESESDGGHVIPQFDLNQDIPTGILSIEASAGTGKTFTLAALVARLIAEGEATASEFLVVTFTRAAADELRGRVRQFLVDAIEALEAPEPVEDGGWLTHLCRVGASERAQRTARLRQAVIDFDALGIATIHGFATQVLGTLGAKAGLDPDARLVADNGELIDQVCADVMASLADDAAVAADDVPTLKKLRNVAQQALMTPGIDLIPDDHDEDASSASRELARRVRLVGDAVAERRRRLGTMAFDDVLVRLRDALAAPGSGEVIDALRSRYRVALIDEFQDTDPVQWAIFERLFDNRTDGSRLILVGDPKQSIYGFRGADIATYSKAIRQRPGLHRFSLGTNWRSDEQLVRALDTLFAGATFGNDIDFPQVTASNKEPRSVVSADGSHCPPLSLHLSTGPSMQRSTANGRWNDQITTEIVRHAIFADLAEHAVDLLSGATLPDGRRVKPDDIAVLTRTHAEAGIIQRALSARGVPAVLARGRSVLETPAASQWRLLLHAMERPSDGGRAKAFALSCFGGHTPDEVSDMSEEEIEVLQDQLRTWVATLETQGVTEWIRQVWTGSQVAAHVLTSADGPRMVIDLDHIAELLQMAAPHDRASVTTLREALDKDPDDGTDTETSGDISDRRIETDADAVTIMTIWNAKGLEFPIVYVPTAWKNPLERGLEKIPTVFVDPQTQRRTYDLTTGDKDWIPNEARRARNVRAGLAQQRALDEDMRVLYVALTRAKHLTVLWWTKAGDSKNSGLAHLLFSRTADGMIDPDTYGKGAAAIPISFEGPTTAALSGLHDRMGDLMEVVNHDNSFIVTPWEGSPPDDTPLDVATLDRHLDRRATRWSFTALTRRMESDAIDPYDSSLADRGAGDEQGPERRRPAVDEPREVLPDDVSVASSLSFLPAGAEFGTLVHSVLEHVDFAAADVRAAVEESVHGVLGAASHTLRPVGSSPGDERSGTDLLIDGLVEVLATPLGPDPDALRLQDIVRNDRLDELAFDLMLGTRNHQANVRDIAHLISSHLPADDVLRPWSEQLADDAGSVDLAGHLTGSIDLVIRTAGDVPRFTVIDYKSNRLHRPDRLPGPDDYSHPHMAQAMADHHYPLQALLYSVALHRYLRWRLTDYRPERHLGGIAYLFVRGMSGPDAPVANGHRSGIFDWEVPSALVVDLSDLLDGAQIGKVPS